jgi:hypothetical protein
MQKRWTFGFAAPVTAALLLVACGGSDPADPRAQRPITNAPEGQTAANSQAAGGAHSTVALSGCVGTASGSSDLVLRSVQAVSGASAAQAQTTAAPGESGITEGSWVRLEAGDHADTLRQAAGQRVTLTGTIVDSGANAVGTSGASGVTTPSGDRSEAASDKSASEKVKDEAGPIGRESMANGTAPLVRITALEGTGETCQEQAVRDGR